MGRCTWSDGKGNWGVRGVDLAKLPPNAYGALYKLHDIERLAEEIRREERPEIAGDLMGELLLLLGLSHHGVPKIQRDPGAQAAKKPPERLNQT